MNAELSPARPHAARPQSRHSVDPSRLWRECAAADRPLTAYVPTHAADLSIPPPGPAVCVEDRREARHFSSWTTRESPSAHPPIQPEVAHVAALVGAPVPRAPESLCRWPQSAPTVKTRPVDTADNGRLPPSGEVGEVRFLAKERGGRAHVRVAPLAVIGLAPETIRSLGAAKARYWACSLPLPAHLETCICTGFEQDRARSPRTPPR